MVPQIFVSLTLVSWERSSMTAQIMINNQPGGFNLVVPPENITPDMVIQYLMEQAKLILLDQDKAIDAISKNPDMKDFIGQVLKP